MASQYWSFLNIYAQWMIGKCLKIVYTNNTKIVQFSIWKLHNFRALCSFHLEPGPCAVFTLNLGFSQFSPWTWAFRSFTLNLGLAQFSPWTWALRSFHLEPGSCAVFTLNLGLEQFSPRNRTLRSLWVNNISRILLIARQRIPGNNLT